MFSTRRMRLGDDGGERSRTDWCLSASASDSKMVKARLPEIGKQLIEKECS